MLWRCSFCGRNTHLVKYLVSLGQPHEVAICDDCVKAAQEVIDLKEKENQEKQK